MSSVALSSRSDIGFDKEKTWREVHELNSEDEDEDLEESYDYSDNEFSIAESPRKSVRSGQKASEYLKETLGDTLTKILTEVAEKRPHDPISYLADCLVREAEEQKGRENENARENQSKATEKGRRRRRRKGTHKIEDAHKIEDEDKLKEDAEVASKKEVGDSIADFDDEDDVELVSKHDNPKKHSLSADSYYTDSNSHSIAGQLATRGRSRKSKIPTRKHVARESYSDLSSYDGISSAPSTFANNRIGDYSAWSYNSYELSGSNSTRRTQSLNDMDRDNTNGDARGKANTRRRKKKKVPIVSMSLEDYKIQRGLSPSKKKRGSIHDVQNGDKSANNSGVGTGDFDFEKHIAKNKKLLHHHL